MIVRDVTLHNLVQLRGFGVKWRRGRGRLQCSHIGHDRSLILALRVVSRRVGVLLPIVVVQCVFEVHFGAIVGEVVLLLVGFGAVMPAIILSRLTHLLKIDNIAHGPLLRLIIDATLTSVYNISIVLVCKVTHDDLRLGSIRRRYRICT